MVPTHSPQREVKVRVWATLTVGLDPENDPCGTVADIEDNTSYAIDVAMFETAQAILKDIEKADDPHNNAILMHLKKKWLVPPIDPEPYKLWSGIRIEGDIDELLDTDTGKKATEEADKIIESIRIRQKKKNTRRNLKLKNKAKARK